MADWTLPFEASYRLVAVDRATGTETPVPALVAGGSVLVNADSEVGWSATLSVAGPVSFGASLARLYLVARFADGTEASEPLGTFVPSVPTRAFDGSSDTWSLELSGRLSEVAGDVLERPATYAAGAPAVASAAAMLTSCGLEVVQEDSSTSVFSSPRTYGVLEERGGRLSAVNDMLSYAGFSAARTDAMGRAVLSRRREQGEKPVAATLSEGAGARFLRSVTDSLDASEVANVVVAVFSGQDSTTVGTAVDDSPASRWSTASLGFRRAKVYDYSDDATQAEADARAASLLASQQSAVRKVEMTCAYMPLEAGDLVSVDYPSAGVEGVMTVRTIRYDLGPGCMASVELTSRVR